MGKRIRLVGAAEIGDRLGVTPQRVQQIISNRNFPEPYQTLIMGRIWDAEVVESWIATHRPHLAEQAGQAEEP